MLYRPLSRAFMPRTWCPAYAWRSPTWTAWFTSSVTPSSGWGAQGSPPALTKRNGECGPHATITILFFWAWSGICTKSPCRWKGLYATGRRGESHYPRILWGTAWPRTKQNGSSPFSFSYSDLWGSILPCSWTRWRTCVISWTLWTSWGSISPILESLDLEDLCPL